MFGKTTKFQQGIISFMMRFNQSFDEMDRLRMIFLTLDKSNDGLLTADEIREGLIKVLGTVKGNLREFQEVMI